MNSCCFMLLILLQLGDSDTQQSIRQGRFFFGDLDFFVHHTAGNSISQASSSSDFVGSQRIYTFRDSLGEFFYGATGNKVYTACFNSRAAPSQGCRGKPVYFPSSPPSYSPPLAVYQPNYEDSIIQNDDVDYVEISADEARRYRPFYGRFDGRENTNVGRGVYRSRGRDVEINCNFPRARDVQRIVWCRIPSHDRGSWVNEPQRRDRLRVERLGRTNTKLIIRNFSKERDAGTYRCFGMRNRDSTLEPVFMETTVNTLPSYYSSDRN
eukprot:TRINITY_DN10693_c0_g1_i1.p1 TRINITY_DN10693_c0_g1~~TRINITY_DN10693_c0_g1_i1.p1  ORF type:complete len:267 (-),score=29.12 TRINITY_DN10693_c0_g1_i1:55-855(-)